MLLGEGTFHQIHGGASTGTVVQRDYFEEWAKQYEKIRSKAWKHPERDAIYLWQTPAVTKASPAIAPDWEAWFAQRFNHVLVETEDSWSRIASRPTHISGSMIERSDWNSKGLVA